MMNHQNFRTYGPPPYPVVVVHGGPGAGGEMAPVARRLSAARSVLEPIQTAVTLDGQIKELREVVESAAGQTPVTLVGYSWGAWLIWLVAARYPAMVKKLILVSSGPFEQAYVEQLSAARQSRLTPAEREEFNQILQALSVPGGEGPSLDELMVRLGQLAAKTDCYMPEITDDQPGDSVGAHGDVYQNVWNAAAAMRQDGRLLRLAAQIRCPVRAIHGDYDPHPAEGVRQPLTEAGLPDFRFTLLTHCGHTPWNEREAREDFYAALEAALGKD